jgi:hypothetical protein
MVIVQSAHRVVELAGRAFGRVDGAYQIPAGPVWPVDLFAQDGVLAEREQHAAQRISQGERGDRPIESADQVAGQAGGVQLAGEHAGTGVVVFLQAEDVGGKRGHARHPLRSRETLQIRARLSDRPQPPGRGQARVLPARREQLQPQRAHLPHRYPDHHRYSARNYRVWDCYAELAWEVENKCSLHQAEISLFQNLSNFLRPRICTPPISRKQPTPMRKTQVTLAVPAGIYSPINGAISIARYSDIEKMLRLSNAAAVHHLSTLKMLSFLTFIPYHMPNEKYAIHATKNIFVKNISGA